MPKAITDVAVGLVGVGYNLALLVARWSVRTPAENAAVAFAVCAFSLFVVLPALLPRWYARRRAWVVVGAKLAAMLCMVRLRQPLHMARWLDLPPKGRWFDVPAALTGLRVGNSMLAGLLQLRWSLWVVQQAVFLLQVLSPEESCATVRLSHPLMADSIARFHTAMSRATSPLLPEAQLFVPKTEVGRCKAAVCFATLLLDFLAPALLLVSPSPLLGPGRDPARRPDAPAVVAARSSWLRRVDDGIANALRWVRAWRGAETLLALYAVIVALWALTAVAF